MKIDKPSHRLVQFSNHSHIGSLICSYGNLWWGLKHFVNNSNYTKKRYKPLNKTDYVNESSESYKQYILVFLVISKMRNCYYQILLCWNCENYSQDDNNGPNSLAYKNDNYSSKQNLNRNDLINKYPVWCTHMLKCYNNQDEIASPNNKT